ncbi:MAG: peptide MFS transporter [Bacteroidetes bacterium]|nr:peptide MFS transporter [Bacteroidota bacterium]MBK7570533.1 peptide MFS transporter [Bacteroidota bacterium]MBK8584234.1 peptide MFS transporter [Bacteroidota bacterium]
MNKDLTLDEIQSFEGKYPKQLWSLFFSEMWERFCFYGMRGMLTFFMVSELFMKEDAANLQYGATQAFVYAFTFIGGLFADKILGFRKSLFWGGLLMITGSCILATNPKDFFFLGLSFTIIGTGFFKPNISTMVGTLYKTGDSRRDAGFSLFYAGINVGALLGGYTCITIGKNYSWNLAFGLAAIVMTISLLTFIFTQKSMGPIGLSPLKPSADGKTKKWYEYLVYIGSLAVIPVIMTMVAKTQYTDWFMYTIGPLTLMYIFYEMTKFNSAERKKIWAALVFIIFSIFFWAFFEQSGGSLSLFAANNLDNTVLGLKLDPNGVNNSANSLFVIIFAPLLGILWIWLSKRNKEPNTVVKFGLGFLFLSLAFYTFYFTRFFADENGMTSLDVFTLAYFIITFGELCLSPIGLSIMTKLAPKPLQGVMMGMWFLASAYGQYAAGLLGAGMTSPKENASAVDKLISYTDGYQQLAIYAAIAGVVLIIISPFVRKLMQEVK